ncbi:MAG: type III pantothenate kinase [Methylococcaceae bacterium]
MNLLLDLGNSRLKWAISENNQLQIEQTLTHFEITPQKLRTFWQDFLPEKVGISSVGKAEILNIIITVAQELWNGIPIHFATSQAEFFDVKNSYLQPEKLGVDRWLALCAARQKTRFPICVVDCGTAITIDVLNENGEHQGGLICAGLTLMKNALASNTADLPFVNAVQKTGLAIQTEAAIFNGTLFSACGLIEKVMQTQTSNTKLFLTGGDAEIIASQLNYAFTLEKNLVLEGLNQVLNSK